MFYQEFIVDISRFKWKAITCLILTLHQIVKKGKKVSHSSFAFCRKLDHVTQLGANLRAGQTRKAKPIS